MDNYAADYLPSAPSDAGIVSKIDMYQPSSVAVPGGVNVAYARETGGQADRAAQTLVKVKRRIEDYVKPDDPETLFTLTQRLAEGSFGVVFRGTFLPTQATVAVKVIELDSDESFEDLIHEIDLLQRCKHANVVGFFGAYKKEKELFIAMELAAGGAVLELMQAMKRPFSERATLFVMRNSFEGIVYLHSIDIIHRDIKAANILVGADAGIKLADFGVSALVDRKRRPRRNTFCGSPYWMAPEVVISNSTGAGYDYQVDVWSLGVTALEMVEGRAPLAHLHPMFAVFQIPHLPPPHVRNPQMVSPAFANLIQVCCTKDPRQRPVPAQVLTHAALQSANTVEARNEVASIVQHVVTAKGAAPPQPAAAAAPSSGGAAQAVGRTLRTIVGGGGSNNKGGRANRPEYSQPRMFGEDCGIGGDGVARTEEEEKKLRKLLKAEMKAIAKMQKAHAKAFQKLAEKQQEEAAKEKRKVDSQVGGALDKLSRDDAETRAQLQEAVGILAEEQQKDLNMLLKAQEQAISQETAKYHQSIRRQVGPPELRFRTIQKQHELALKAMRVYQDKSTTNILQQQQLVSTHRVRRAEARKKVLAMKHNMEAALVQTYDNLAREHRLQCHRLSESQLAERQKLERESKRKQGAASSASKAEAAEMEKTLESVHAEQVRQLQAEFQQNEAKFAAAAQPRMLMHKRAVLEERISTNVALRDDALRMNETHLRQLLGMRSAHRDAALKHKQNGDTIEINLLRQFVPPPQVNDALEKRKREFAMLAQTYDMLINQVRQNAAAEQAKMRSGYDSLIAQDQQVLRSLPMPGGHPGQSAQQLPPQQQQRHGGTMGAPGSGRASPGASHTMMHQQAHGRAASMQLNTQGQQPQPVSQGYGPTPVHPQAQPQRPVSQGYAPTPTHPQAQQVPISQGYAPTPTHPQAQRSPYGNVQPGYGGVQHPQMQPGYGNRGPGGPMR
mmetsp:Transcript_6691/g.21657  ORF Transcript_6691/g.21657 Transcript_6691/m.21657 type:complete len:955 (-) Transcript_6691:986-3850(-)